MNKVLEFIKKNQQQTIIAAFGVLSIILINIGVLGLKEPVVAVCVAVMLEVGIAVMLHNAEIWMHVVAIAIQIIAGLLIDRIALMIICILMYVIAILSLLLLSKNSPVMK